jgi:hypothetical protein
MLIIPILTLIAAILMAMWAHHEQSTPMYVMALCLLIAACVSAMIVTVVGRMVLG